MPSYLLPCACGEKTPVTASQAGQSVRCSCGAQLEVPTLRGLRDLAQGDSVARPARTWNNRHRATFVFFVLAMAAFAVSGYQALNLPPAATPATDQQISQAFENGSTGEIFASYEELKKGIAFVPPDESAIQKYVGKRDSLVWGVRVVLGLGVLALVAAAAVALAGRKGNGRGKTQTRVV
jgi:hypothetical protein